MGNATFSVTKKGDAMTIDLATLHLSNWRDCAALQLAESQHDFMPSNLESIVEGQWFPKSKRVVIIHSELGAVGYAAYGEEEGSQRKKVFRLMIDYRHQKRGFGRDAMKLILQEMFTDPGVKEIFICYHPRNEGARQLYRSLGFKELGHLPCTRNPEGKIEARLERSSV